MSADPRTEAAARALADRDGWTSYTQARSVVAAADAAALADVQLHARITAWIARIYKDEQPTDRQVRMVLAALTALQQEQQQ